jgi:hypothetical protein
MRSVSSPCYLTDLCQFHAGELRYQPVVFVPERGENGGKDRKGRPKRSLASPYSDVSSRYALDDGNEQNWALCDKDCGWCGHCGDGII